MNKDVLIFENKDGAVAKIINLPSDKVYVVYRYDKRGLDFVSDLKTLEVSKVQYSVLAETKKSSIKKSGEPVEKVGKLRVVSSDEAIKLREEAAERQEEEDQLVPFMQKSAAGHVGLLALILISSFIINKFFPSNPAPQVVTVFEQKREDQKPVVQASQKKITQPKQVTKAKVSNKTKIAKSYARTQQTNQRKVVTRPGTSVKQMGALAALGGMSKNHSGTGGLNLNSKSRNPGIGYGGAAARGGYERGMIGKGLVKTGVGGGGSMQGYGGYATKGMGGGEPGYGSGRIAGSSGSYFEPLSEESMVEGGLDEDQINAVIQRNIGQVIYCYEQGLQSKPNLRGRVAVKFVINGSGRVSTANVTSSSIESRNVESCIVAKLRNWKFPRPVGNVNVRVTRPFTLKRLAQG